MKQTEIERVKKNVKELTDLLYDSDEIVFFDKRKQLPQRNMC